jgi:Zn-dependent peptidase ImmA (M78 family)
VARWIDDYNDLEALLLEAGAIEKNPFRLAVLRKQLADHPSGEDRARKAAAAARKKLGLDGAPIRDICGLLEEHGAKVYTPQLASELFFGLSVADGDGGPAIVVNTWDRLSVERWIFTAAHELGHLLLHLDDRTYDASRSEENPAQEKEADVFASHFLMPEDIFRREVEEARGLPLFDAVFKLKRMFHVSWKTVLYRLSDETPRGRAVWGMFQKQCAQRLGQTVGAREEPEGLDLHDFRNMRPPARAADEPSHLDLSDFLGGRLLRLVRIAVEKQIVSMSRAAEILRKDQESMRNLVNEWMK